MYLLHTSKPNIPYMFTNCAFYPSHTITCWGTMYAEIFNRMLHTLECNHILTPNMQATTFILEVNYDASDKGCNISNIRVYLRESILLDMKYTPFLPSTHFYLTFTGPRITKYIRGVQPTRWNVSQLIYFCKTLYMFQTVFTSIIRSLASQASNR